MRTKNFGTGRFMGLAAAGAVGLAMGTSGVAHAQSINNTLLELADLGNAIGEPRNYSFRDADVTVIESQQDSGVLQSGDVLRGAFTIESMFRGTDSIEMGDNGRNNVFGRFSLRIDEVTGTGNIIFGPDDSASFTSLQPDVLVEFYESATQSIDLSNADTTNSGGFDFGAFTHADTTFWGAAGFGTEQTASYRYDLTLDGGEDAVIPDGSGGYQVDMSYIAANYSIEDNITDGASIRLDWLDGVVTQTSTIEEIRRQGSSNTHVFSNDATIYLSSDQEKFTSTATFGSSFVIVPLPTAAWAGLTLLGLLGGTRVIRNRMIEQKD